MFTPRQSSREVLMSFLAKVKNIFKIGKTPPDLIIHARQCDVSQQSNLSYKSAMTSNLYWFDNDPVKTHFFNALQSVFPEGERFFIDSARDGLEAIEKGDARNNRLVSEEEVRQLKAHVKKFIYQEAQHGREHEIINEALISLGYDRISYYTEIQRKSRIKIRQKLSVSYRLSITAAAEHFTAAFSHFALCKKADLFDRADSPFRELLLFHCAEEIEHKAVCYDLYQLQHGGYFLRIWGLVLAVLDEAINVRYKHRYLLKKDGKWTFRYRLKAWAFIWGPKGIAFSLLPLLLKYLNPWFHPWDIDERARIETMLPKPV